MAVHDFRSQRLFVKDRLSKNTVLDASREQANYLLNVLRIGDGGSILIFNGKDGEWLATIKAAGRKKCTLIPVEQTRLQPAAPSLEYLFAPLKQARLDYMVQKAVEMGAGILQPVITQYTQVRVTKPDRLHANTIEAAEQCGILTLPEIREPIDIPALSRHLGEDRILVFCDEAESCNNLRTGLNGNSDKKISVLIGPEGGFSDEERKFLYNLPNVIVLGLGPRILRADTAAVAALALVQATIGDWYKQV